MYTTVSHHLIDRITDARRHMHHHRAGLYFTAYVLYMRTFGHVTTLRQARDTAGLIITQREHDTRP